MTIAHPDRRAVLMLLRGRPNNADPDAAAVAHMLEINAALCSGCDICARICPQGALQLMESAAEAGYIVDPAKCDGCGVCEELCDHDAIQVARGSITPRQTISLARARCRSCGAPFHWPMARGDAPANCRICSVKRVSACA